MASCPIAALARARGFPSPGNWQRMSKHVFYLTWRLTESLFSAYFFFFFFLTFSHSGCLAEVLSEMMQALKGIRHLHSSSVKQAGNCGSVGSVQCVIKTRISPLKEGQK